MTPSAKKSLFAINILAFFLSFQNALPAYINSSFLSQFLNKGGVSLVYSIASLLAIIVSFKLPSILRKLGNFKLSVVLVSLQFISMSALYVLENPFFIIPIFTLSMTLLSIANISVDIFAEKYTKNSLTGTIRGFFLTACNLAWLFSPVISAFILVQSGYESIYGASALILLPVLMMIGLFKNFEDDKYERLPVVNTIKTIVKDRNISISFMCAFFMHFFYSWMIIYTPIYLVESINMDWSEIGVIFTIMLLPFVLIQLPLGIIADRYFGEKEIMALGFLTMSLFTGMISFITLNVFWLWASILFMTRIGAAAVEIMNETYFFKQIDDSKADIISLFRMMRQVAYVIGPLIAATILFTADMKWMFIVLAVIMLIGVSLSLRLKDTK